MQSADIRLMVSTGYADGQSQQLLACKYEFDWFVKQFWLMTDELTEQTEYEIGSNTGHSVFFKPMRLEKVGDQNAVYDHS